MNAFSTQRDGSVDRRRNAAAFSGKTNPARPSAVERGRREAPGFPAKCNPRPPRAPLSDAQRDLAEQYVPLARSMAHRFAKSWPSGADDFRATASLALVEAAQAFEPARGVDFATFARRRIHGALVDAQRGFFWEGWRGAAEFRPRFTPLADDVEARGAVLGVRCDDPVGADLEAKDDVDHWLRKLPARHAAAFRHIYFEGKTQEETAVLVGCSKAAMSRLHRETLDRFREARGVRGLEAYDRLPVLAAG